ncbi:MAG: bifunctional proline dehydrogenase/L-glutamate gamma-semialdehyde dehydrogenase PutA [Magnetospirillum sp.]|nr:bifunctional proline dehydrogenase/L-glutamate gamma-semialdehyde dehydrogenase PutA [Magnetospirillum sp.]
MLFSAPLPAPSPARLRLRHAVAEDEDTAAARLIEAARQPEGVAAAAVRLVDGVRQRRTRLGDLDAFLSEYKLSSQEGVVLMCLAEALLRIPDPATADRLIRDKVGGAEWRRHLGHSPSAFVNASTWALMLTGRLLRLDEPVAEGGLAAAAGRLAARAGEPVVREALAQGMRIMARQFVMGRSIDEALTRAAEWERRGFRHSFDMLGEAARTGADALRYFDAYAGAIAALGRVGGEPVTAPGISVKLSALHPRFEFAQRARLLAELVPRLGELCRLAAAAGIGLTVDAEEADRLEPTLDVVEAVLAEPGLGGWEGFGLAVQAYQKRAPALVDWLGELAQARRRRLMVRLVKGAYWDSEIKRAQERGLAAFPVFTRKAATDACFLVCARKLLAAPAAFFPQFATHNAYTVAAVTDMAGDRRDWEFQRLHGMGEALYAQVVGQHPCRTYAPVGSHEDLLPYLVRRLLENGANTSFVNRIADETVPVEVVAADPVAALAAASPKADPRIPLPADLFSPRRNSRGLDLTDPPTLDKLDAAMAEAASHHWSAAPVVGGDEVGGGPTEPVQDPADRRRTVGTVTAAQPAEIARAVSLAVEAADGWDGRDAENRAAILERAADLYEDHAATLMAVAVREAGKTIGDAAAEMREAVDFLRFYAAEARRLFLPQPLPGVAGESNTLSLHGRGVFACISPWNFPLAIFTGQVAAALAAGNAVVAKPAEQTPLMAAHAVRLLHQAGVPPNVLHLLPGDGSVGEALIRQPGVAGVAFTGAMATARAIAGRLAVREGPLVPLIAETGGQNAMIVDSSALPEQVVADVLDSAFRSAGQRCSAARLLFVQQDVFPRITRMLAGAAEELVVGDPARLATDVGPVIDQDALDALQAHAAGMPRPLVQCRLGPDCRHGTFFAPRAVVLDDIGALGGEVFGPFLHVVPFGADRLDAVCAAVAGTGCGLTLGIHSRIDATVEFIRRRLKVGNLYVNRSQIVAVVGSQPFGGEGLSGTGPKAGGPFTLPRFAVERTVTINTTAAGGNAALLSLGEESGQKI